MGNRGVILCATDVDIVHERGIREALQFFISQTKYDKRCHMNVP